VQEGEATGGADGDLQPRLPRQRLERRAPPEEVVLEAAARHELVDQEALLVLATVPQQLHQVLVPELPKEDHLRLQPCT
jgi:hypothetical protein